MPQFALKGAKVISNWCSTHWWIEKISSHWQVRCIPSVLFHLQNDNGTLFLIVSGSLGLTCNPKEYGTQSNLEASYYYKNMF